MRPILLAAIVALCAACGDDAPPQFEDGPVTDAPTVDADTTDASCFTNPQTHLEIINACTTAEKIDKHPVLPLQLPDGGLPPLP